MTHIALQLKTNWQENSPLSQFEEQLSPFAEQIGTLARDALVAEVMLSPKPGLVDQWDTGSHSDLTVEMMVRSANCLAPYFAQMAAEGQRYQSQQSADDLLSLRERIGLIGRQAESQMMQVTEGVNTHRGAIWALGLLATSAGMLGEHATPNDFCVLAGRIACLPDKFVKQTWSKGLKATRQYQVNGAREQAQNGFPAIIGIALPALISSRLHSSSESHAQLDALVALMANLTDTCVLARAGLQGLTLMQHGASDIIKVGGTSTELGFSKLIKLNKDMVAINASPGGAADLLAATLFIDAITNRKAILVGQ
ncbi:triphosphoribosyl-dephospho-CoA synthase [Vibrio sp. EA2]|uniref:triphosphoribosyl-dephospho-CoA synthase n=1 Tax=Vibrio sp. EA2 TaxID=3079860 RepID=UPI00294A104F|nr:triphosphoribosyl-dephospho-CoA synthase [Vibrio sp. EA2]MDV6250684.1 triphosphoribosyl-dephospho-CoA synthase [Vibrio sp. EA2]